MKVVLINKNPKSQFAQGNNHPVFTGLHTLSQDIHNYNPDWVFISMKHGMDQVREAIKNTKAAYLYADYRNPLPKFTIEFSKMANITLTSWKHPKLWKTLKNPHVVMRATDPTEFFPIPEIKPEYDVVFGGNNFGGDPRMKVMNFLNKHFNLFIIGAGWPSKFNSSGKARSYIHLNRTLNKGKVTVGAFNLIDKFKDGTSYYTSNRPYQNMAVGRPHLSPHCPGVSEFFKNGYMEYMNLGHLKELVELLLNMTQKERDKIGKIQRKEIVENHTYKHGWEYMEKVVKENLF